MKQKLENENFWPDHKDRNAIQTHVTKALSAAIDSLPDGPVTPTVTPATIREKLTAFDFNMPIDLKEACDRVIDLLKAGTVHMMHPAYMGLFNPTCGFPGILADQITATFNPQLAVWSHAPAAVEIERYTVNAMAELFGWQPHNTAGHFTSGGAEANHTSILLALTRACPAYADRGIGAFGGQPVIYVSKESHLAWLKIAHQAGIGRQAVRLVETDGMGRMVPEKLTEAIEQDKAGGNIPVFIGATAGTTNAGMIDPLPACRDIADRYGLWLHVDAAWGGAGYLSPKSRASLRGIEDADSITIDAHKWLAVPMGAGMLLCRNEAILAETFRVSASYMPPTTEETVDPYTNSMQWSRRFIGLKLFLTLATIGWEGYRAHIEHSLKLADILRDELKGHNWDVVNDSPLAVVCFRDGLDMVSPEEAAAAIVEQGNAWISVARFENRPVLRACITSHLCEADHIRTLVDSLNRLRADLGNRAACSHVPGPSPKAARPAGS